MNEAIALSSPAVAGGHRRDDRLVAVWLLAVAAMIFVMVVIGGITRLTESGLSITEWKPVSGVIPPLDAAAWQQEFDHYKAIPEFQKLRPDMTLAEFKGIFWWEYVHRLWGRLIGIAFALPGLWLLVARPDQARASPAAGRPLHPGRAAGGARLVHGGERALAAHRRQPVPPGGPSALRAADLWTFMLWTAFGLLRPQPPLCRGRRLAPARPRPAHPHHRHADHRGLHGRAGRRQDLQQLPPHGGKPRPWRYPGPGAALVEPLRESGRRPSSSIAGSP